MTEVRIRLLVNSWKNIFSLSCLLHLKEISNDVLGIKVKIKTVPIGKKLNFDFCTS